MSFIPSQPSEIPEELNKSSSKQGVLFLSGQLKQECVGEQNPKQSRLSTAWQKNIEGEKVRD